MPNKITSPDEANQFVLDVTTKLYNELTFEISKLDESQRFLVKSRIVALMYHTHFSETLEETEQKLKNAGVKNG